MDTIEFNKIAGAILFALLVFFGAKTASNIIFKVDKPDKPGFEIEVAEAPDHGAKEAAPEAAGVPFAALLAKASAEKGQGIAKKCIACHTFNTGGANKIGPNLYGVVGSALGSVKGFAYSKALKAKGGSWDYESLDKYLTKPKDFINGTKMMFPGIKQAEQRAHVIVYLRQQGDNPPPLPMPKAGAAAEPKAAATPTPEKPAAMPPADVEPIGSRLAKADVERGKKISAKCAMCHTFDKGGKNKIGPNLYGVVGRYVAMMPDFKYSDAVRADWGKWTYEQLDCFIAKPKACIPGTRMPFPGLPDPAARADLLAFLRTLSDSPAPLPAP
ncbi:MAG: c-type cytochrome [Methyloligellaceae bacterium]